MGCMMKANDDIDCSGKVSSPQRSRSRILRNIRGSTFFIVIIVLTFGRTHSFAVSRRKAPFRFLNTRSKRFPFYHSSSNAAPISFRIQKATVGLGSSTKISPFSLSMIGDGEIILIVTNDDDDENRENEDNEEEEEEEENEDPYMKMASSEFQDSETKNLSVSSAIPALSSENKNPSSPATDIDWGGALGTLRKRVDDVEQGLSGNPSQDLFRLMSAQSPNQMIGNFVKQANPQVVQAMSGAVDSLLGGLSNPVTGIEMIVKATGDKIGSLCFQLQMTG